VKKMKLKVQFSIIGVILVLLVPALALSAQDSTKLREEIRDKMAKSPRWVGIKAFKQADTRICDEVGQVNGAWHCWTFVKYVAFVKNISDPKTNCNNLPPQFRAYTDLCSALKQSNCKSLSGYQMNMCNAFLLNDVALMEKALSDPEMPDFIHNKKEGAKFFINMFNGFKTGSERDCNKFSSPNLILNASCNALFGSKDFGQEFNSISEDIFKAVKAKEAKNDKLCEEIRHDSIKSVCHNQSISTTDEIIDSVWH